MQFRVISKRRPVGLPGLAALIACAVGGCSSCDDGGFPVDAPMPDATLRGTVSLAWSLTDQMGHPIRCDDVGATFVFLELRSKSSLSGTRNPQRVKILSIKESLVQPELTFSQIQKLLVDGRAAPIAQLWTEINRVNGMGEAAVEDADETFRDEPAVGDDLLDS